MRIKNEIGTQPGVDRTQLEKFERAQAETNKPQTVEHDTVHVSEEAKLRSMALQEATGHSGVRAERVAELKAQVQSGTYEPDSRKIAEKLLQDEVNLFV